MSLLNALYLVYMMLGMVYLALTMMVLHTHQTKTKKLPPAFMFWAFNSELREAFPDATRWARAIFIIGLVLAVPFTYFVLSK